MLAFTFIMATSSLVLTDPLHSEKSMFYTTVEQMHNFVLHYFTLVYISGILPLYNLCKDTFYTAM